MVFYDEDIKNDIKKGVLPQQIARLFVHAFQALDQTGDLNLFDIKKLKTSSSDEFYRLRKGKYRAIFTMSGRDFYVHAITKRGEVYRKWP
ncbi:type II toxin-antitoxin system RelE family toxin [Spirochaeta africana]|uniref:Cytotoxic translational repressor of toxin-antitoxin stability system n=1 Tax=Spirochaeta africana (strain ATCC 700263 / DSM 8902 / Z-7692) TaxID=889378 RepID=H9UF34_SPIAZ|nr:hypothetical protein [Spirochaeta africana]AFG36127.1 hypothetical protein Spiaf_0017 [Spirochaeta africana DSM 8902]